MIEKEKVKNEEGENKKRIRSKKRSGETWGGVEEEKGKIKTEETERVTKKQKAQDDDRRMKKKWRKLN